VDDGYWAVSTVDRSQKRQSDCVITAESDNSWKGLPVQGWTFLFRVCGRCTGQDRVVSLFDLVKSPGVVISAAVSTVVEVRVESYEVTGISPQSSTVAQLLNGFVSNGTLYPPLKPNLREPIFTNKVSA